MDINILLNQEHERRFKVAKRLVLDRDLNAQIEANTRKAWEERNNAGKESDKETEGTGGEEETESE